MLHRSQTFCFIDVHTLHAWWHCLLGLWELFFRYVSTVGATQSQYRSAALISVVVVDKCAACRGYYGTICKGFELGVCFSTKGTISVRHVFHCVIPYFYVLPLSVSLSSPFH